MKIAHGFCCLLSMKKKNNIPCMQMSAELKQQIYRTDHAKSIIMRSSWVPYAVRVSVRSLNDMQ